MPSDSALESSLAAKLGTMQLCVSSIVIKAFPKEEGNVTTEKYHGGQFRKSIHANQFLDLKQASM